MLCSVISVNYNGDGTRQREHIPINDSHGDVPANGGGKGPDKRHYTGEERRGYHDIERSCTGDSSAACREQRRPSNNLPVRSESSPARIRPRAEQAFAIDNR